MVMIAETFRWVCLGCLYVLPAKRCWTLEYQSFSLFQYGVLILRHDIHIYRYALLVTERCPANASAWRA